MSYYIKSISKKTFALLIFVAMTMSMILMPFLASDAAGFTPQNGVLPTADQVWNTYYTQGNGIGRYDGAWTTLTRYNNNYIAVKNPNTGAFYAPGVSEQYYLAQRENEGHYGQNIVVTNWALGNYNGRTNPADTLPGQHTYQGTHSPLREGVVPVNWKVAWYDSACIHEFANSSVYGLHNLGSIGQSHKCGRAYNYGYVAVCADCGYVYPGYVYGSKYLFEHLPYIITGENGIRSTYAYICPYDGINGEQSAGFGAHHCIGTSWNGYYINYNGNGATGAVGGASMGNSWHIYGGNKEYEGATYNNVATTLSLNNYYRVGYTFAGWATTPGGSVVFGDGAEVASVENAFKSIIESGDGKTITLYAVWTSANTTLHIDANGGTYNGNPTYDSTKGYVDNRAGSSVINNNGTLVNGSLLSGPQGYLVTYEANGGTSTESSAYTGTVFDGWEKDFSSTSSFKDNNNGTWTFGHTNLGHIDVIKAVWRTGSVVLPDCTKNNAVFTGWYNGSEYVGKAGDLYAPSGNVTLTAHWSTMSLNVTENYIQNLTGTTPYNGYLGAANLTTVWDVSSLSRGTYNYRYLLSTNGSSYSVVGTNNSNIITNQSGTNTFNTSTATQTKTITYGGIYTITASGAQGGNFGSNAGGRGATVSANFMLNPGDVISFRVGGQGRAGGNSTGGATTDSTKGANGGDATYVYLTRNGVQSLIMVAGGGGGASVGAIGGNAGGYVSGTAGAGTNGVAGGGGGIQDGTWGNNGVFTEVTKVQTVTVVRATRDWGTYASGHPYYYSYYSFTPNFTFTCPSNGRTYYKGTTYYRESRARFAYDEMYVYECNSGYGRGAMLYGSSDYSTNEYNETSTSGDIEAYIGKNSVISGNANGNLSFNFNVSTTSVSASYGGGSWICPDSVCAHTTATYSTGNSGKTGNGTASITTPGTIYNTVPPAEVLVNAQDTAAPDNLTDGDLTALTRTENVENNTLALTWNITEDNGTQYWFKAGAYAVGLNGVSNSPSVMTEANTVTLTTGVTEYRYLINSNPTAAYSSTWTSVKTRWSTNSPATNDYSGRTKDSKYTAWYNTYGHESDSSVTISNIPLLTGGERYIHIVAIDRAGNVSAVSNFQIETVVPDPVFGTPHPVRTNQLTVTDEPGDNVYFNDGIYYIKNDGSPFTVNYSAYIDGAARENYQVEDAYLNSETGRHFIAVPLTALLESVDTDYSSLTTLGSPSVITRDANNVIRTGYGRVLSFNALTTLTEKGVENEIFVYPQASAYREKEWALYFEKDQAERLVNSNDALDRANGITLKGDITSPAIVGWTPDENGDIVVNINDNLINSVTFTFTDTGSGIAKITVHIIGSDDIVTNYTTYTTSASVTLPVPDDGVHVFEIVVTDNVGNENVYISEGSYKNNVCAPDPSWGSPAPYRITVVKDTTGPRIWANNVDRSGPSQENVDDLNNNGMVDEGEVYVDNNGNGHLDPGEESANLYEMVKGPTPEENPLIDEIPANKEYDHMIAQPGGTPVNGELDTTYCDEVNLVAIAPDGTRKYEWTYGWVGGVDKYVTLDLWARDSESGLKDLEIYAAQSDFSYSASDILTEVPKDGASVRLVDGVPVLPAAVETFVSSDYCQNKVLYVAREGITHYVIRAVDEFDNETYVELTVKLDRTAPLVEDSLTGLKTTLTERALAVTESLEALDKGDFEDMTGVTPEEHETLEDTFEAAHINYWVYISASDVIDGINSSGINRFYLKVTNRDNGLTKIFDTSNSYYGSGSFHNGDMTAGLRINLLSDSDRALFSGDFDLNVVVMDNAYNRTSAVSSLRAFTLKAYLNSKFFPSHDEASTYFRGEDVKLIIKTSGFADAIRIELPRELYLDPETGEISETYIRAFYSGNGIHVLDSNGNVVQLEPNERNIVNITGDIVQIDIDYNSITDAEKREVGEYECEIELLMPYFVTVPDPSDYEIKVTAYKNASGLTDNDVIDINPDGNPNSDVVKLERILPFTLNGSILEDYRSIEVSMT